MRSATVPRYGFADEPHTCAWHNCGQTIHLVDMVTLDREDGRGRDHFHVGCWGDRVAHEIAVWKGEER